MATTRYHNEWGRDVGLWTGWRNGRIRHSNLEGAHGMEMRVTMSSALGLAISKRALCECGVPGSGDKGPAYRNGAKGSSA